MQNPYQIWSLPLAGFERVTTWRSLAPAYTPSLTSRPSKSFPSAAQISTLLKTHTRFLNKVMFFSAFVVLSLSASAFANLYVRSFYHPYPHPCMILTAIQITQPVSSTTWTGGQQSTVSWQDDGQQPSLAQFGLAMVSIYAGNSQQQVNMDTFLRVASMAVGFTRTLFYSGFVSA